MGSQPERNLNMRNTALLIFAILALTLAPGGCGNEGEPTTAPPVDDPVEDIHTGEDVSDDVSSDVTVESDTGPALEGPLIQGFLSDFWTNAPIEGAEVCVEGDEDIPCVWSGVDGMYYLAGLEEETLIVLTIAAPGAYPMRFPMNTRTEVVWDFQVPSTDVVDVLLVSLGAEIGDQSVVGGFISIAYTDESTDTDSGLYQGDFLEGMRVLMEPQVGVGPFYFLEGLPDPAATGTDDSGIAAAGNLPAGTYAVRFQHNDRACRPGQGLETDDSGWTTFEVLPGHQTIVTGICANPPEGGVVISGSITHLSNGEAATGVSVCLDDAPEVPCDLSSDTGAYSIIGAPAQSPVVLELSGPELRTLASPLHTEGDTEWATRVFTKEVHSWLYESIGLSPEDPQETGDLLLQVYDATTIPDGGHQGQGVDGVQLEVTSGDDSGAYFFAGGVPSTNSSATDASGLGLVPNLPAGVHEVILEHPERSCGPGAGFPGSNDKPMEVEIWPGKTTVLTAQCEAPEVPGATISGVITGFATGAGAPGVSICIEGMPEIPCAVSDDEGGYMLKGAPLHEEITVRVEGEGLRPIRSLLFTGDGATWNNRVISNELHAWLLGSVGVPPTEEAVGDVVLVAYDQSTIPVGSYQGTPLAGVSLQVEPGPTHGPFYFDEDDAPSVEATATHALGIGFAPNLPPGTYTISFTHPSHKCVIGNGLTPDGDSSYTLEVTSGAVTTLGITCYPLNPEGVTLTGTLVDFATGEPAPDVVLCLEGLDDIPCAVSEADGTYSLTGAPPDTLVDLSLSGWGYKDLHTWLYTADGVSWSSPMLSGTLHEQILGLVGVNPKSPFDHGDFVMRAYDGSTLSEGTYQGTPQSDVTFALEPVDGDGPFYFSSSVGAPGAFSAPIPSPTATATDDLGLGFIANLSSGDYVLTCAHPDKTCVPGQGLTLSEGDATSFKLSPGVITVITCICD